MEGMGRRGGGRAVSDCHLPPPPPGDVRHLSDSGPDRQRSADTASGTTGKSSLQLAALESELL